MKCVYCNIVVSEIKNQTATYGFSAGVCHNCGHVVIIGFHTNTTYKSYYKYLHDSWSKNELKKLWKVQERIHHELGQWG